MTILVVDAFRIAADRYATINDGEVEYQDMGYRKIFAITPLALDTTTQSRPVMGFVGDAMAFEAFLDAYREQQPTRLEDVKRLIGRGPGGFRVIVPIEGGAIVISHNGDGVRHETVEGETLVFGGDHSEEQCQTYKAWFMIFLDAYRDKKIPGLEVDSLMYGDHEVKTETLLNDEQARKQRRRRRHPFLRSKTQYAR